MVDLKELERLAKAAEDAAGGKIVDVMGAIDAAEAFRRAANTGTVLSMVARLRRVDMVADTLEREAGNAHVDTAALMMRIVRELRGTDGAE